VVTTFPRWMLGFLRARTHGLASPMPEAYAILFQRAHRMLAGAFNRYVYGRWYNIVRPRILWRLTRRHVVPGLDMERTRRVVVHGVAGVTTGWRLGKSYPSIPVTTDLNPPHEKAQVVTSAAERADGRG
jgi:hypothetical protein